IISHNGNHAMAHLDARDLTDENIDFLLQQVPSPNHTAPVHPHIFISIHNRPEGSNHSQPGTPARFARNLIESYYPRTPPNNTWNPNLSEFLTQGIPAGHNIRVVDRSNEAHTNMFTHPEIGLAINPTNGQLDIFGQIAGYDETRRPRRGVNTHFTLPLNAPQESFDGVTTRGRINLQGASLLP
ncbi:MAG: hypothetical protein LIP01_01435, partial [Tannerellaceae bacterium]|nr:hypothetical protein [Tannerellaceae bacterium]